MQYTGFNQTLNVGNDTTQDVLVSENAACPTPDVAADLFAFIFDTVIVGIVSLVGIAGNILSIASFMIGRQTTTSYLLIALAAVDTLYLTTHGIMFQALRSIYPYTGAFKSYLDAWPYIEVWEFPLGVSFLTLSIYCNVLVAVDRYIGVCWPLHASGWCTKKRALVTIGVVTVLAFSLNITRFFIQKPVEKYDNCTDSMVVVMIPDQLGTSQVYNHVMGSVHLILIFLLPNLIVLCINIRLFWAMRKSFRMTTLARVIRRHHNLEKKTSVMLFVVSTVFVICQTPISVNHLLYAIKRTMEPSAQRYYNILTNTLAVLNSAINFFIYFILSKTFRTQLKSLFKRKNPRRKSALAATSNPAFESRSSFLSRDTSVSTTYRRPRVEVANLKLYEEHVSFKLRDDEECEIFV